MRLPRRTRSGLRHKIAERIRAFTVDSHEIIGAGQPCGLFDSWVELLNRAGIAARQIRIADYDSQQGYNPPQHPRGNEVYVLVPADRIEEALRLLRSVNT